MPIEPVTAAAATVFFIGPYLAKMGEAAAEKIGEAGADAAGKVLGWLRNKLTPGGREALQDLEQVPENVDRQGALRVQLEKVLEQHPELLAELEAMLPAEAIEQGGAMVQNVSGVGAKASMTKGSGNTTTIS